MTAAVHVGQPGQMTVLQDPPAFFDVDERLEAQIFIRAVLDRTSRIDAVDVARGCRAFSSAAANVWYWTTTRGDGRAEPRIGCGRN